MKLIRTVAACAAALIGVGLTSCAPTVSAEHPSAPTVSAIPDALLVPDDAHYIARADSSNTLVLFTDYQCPYCAMMDDLIARAMTDYAGKINIVVRNFPLPQHENAVPAALAAEAAANQGKLAEMATLIFDGQDNWAKIADPGDTWIRYAEQLDLDLEQFRRDFEAPQTLERVRDDYHAGAQAHVTQTPSLFLNGRPLPVDSSTYDTLTVPLDDLLE